MLSNLLPYLSALRSVVGAFGSQKVSHWEIERNSAYGYDHQYVGDAEKPPLFARIESRFGSGEGIETDSRPI